MDVTNILYHTNTTARILIELHSNIAYISEYISYSLSWAKASTYIVFSLSLSKQNLRQVTLIKYILRWIDRAQV